MITCVVTVILNLTAVWTPDDQVTLDRAKQRCATIYPDAPCLKKFTKTEELTYRAICGLDAKKRTVWTSDSKLRL